MFRAAPGGGGDGGGLSPNQPHFHFHMGFLGLHFPPLSSLNRIHSQNRGSSQQQLNTMFVAMTSTLLCIRLFKCGLSCPALLLTSVVNKFMLIVLMYFISCLIGVSL